jgi:hypothetical protein
MGCPDYLLSTAPEGSLGNRNNLTNTPIGILDSEAETLKDQLDIE